ncbi:LOW QUALITY PROTEIN: hypothetical protein CVT25_001119 [Psilocybe cyanescens]|uniref:Uncharacterized protein n=1 Tax=Psilocybe cyanescens TaxID=93625 RepID=A0A409XEL6_PSICY|nr:LOW QUALITY PROTEIN: hypothetical protein CVT25_001119 [Psilocybe cyanescens]
MSSAKGGSDGGSVQYHDDNTWDARTGGSMSINAPYTSTSSFGSRSQVFGNDAYDAYLGQPPMAHAGSALEDGSSPSYLEGGSLLLSLSALSPSSTPGGGMAGPSADLILVDRRWIGLLEWNL